MIVKRRVLDYTLAGLLLLVPILILHSGLKEPAQQSRFDQAVLRVSSPLQAAVSWVIEGIGDVLTSYVILVDVEEENQELRAENEQLRRDLAAALRQAEDVAAIEELAGLRKRTAADTLGARVISASVNPHFRVVRLRLDRGEGEVQAGMPVIDSRGLIGRISTVYGRYSDVLLAADPGSAIDVKVSRTGERGVLKGMGRDDSYHCAIEWLGRGETVEVGDLIITSGLGSAFPEGIPVGHITEISTKDYGLYQEVTVEPIVDFSKLGEVMVLLAPPPPPDPDGGERVGSRDARGVVPY